MIRLLLATVLASGLALTGARAQTDDRILNDALVLLHGTAIVERTAEICVAADMDLSADVAGWNERNAGLLATLNAVVARRGGFETGVSEAAAERAQGEAARGFVSEPDRAGYCERVGEAIDAGQLDLATWYPTEARRITEAADGKWPPLDLADAAPVADAIALKSQAFMMADRLARCATLHPPARPFEEARVEWEARNSYAIELADRVLANWGALHPQRWEDARDAAGSETDARVADAAGFEMYCGTIVAGIMGGDEDVDRTQPVLYESVLSNAEIMP